MRDSRPIYLSGSRLVFLSGVTRLFFEEYRVLSVGKSRYED
jgi:hypothetical protein